MAPHQGDIKCCKKMEVKKLKKSLQRNIFMLVLEKITIKVI